jgi:5'-nucleotidase
MARILLTNDDGIGSAGLAALAGALGELGALAVAAPSGERSGASHSISVRRPVACEEVAPRRWSVDGTPADAVIIALHKLLDGPPDLVVSGINLGANIGQNIHYSGTVGAALEATVNRIPAFALSIATRNPECDWAPAARLGRELAQLLLEEKLPEGILLNVNVPPGWNGSVRFARQSETVTRNVLREEPGPRGPMFWLQEVQPMEAHAPDSDYAALLDGAAAITPLYAHRTHVGSLNHLSHLAAALENRLGRSAR